MSTGRADLRDARCTECGARCIPGQTHLEHNLGWKKKVCFTDYAELMYKGYPGWDIVDPGGGWDKHPPKVQLAIQNKVSKSSEDICKEFDDIAVGRFYSEDLSRSGSAFVGPKEWYDAQWFFEKREDAYTFIKRYGGTAG